MASSALAWAVVMSRLAWPCSRPVMTSYVEQLSTIVDSDGTHVSMVCHILSVVDGVITGQRGYRNERGIPAGRDGQPHPRTNGES